MLGAKFTQNLHEPILHIAMKKTIGPHILMLLGLVALFHFTSCNPADENNNNNTIGETVTDASGNTYNTVIVGRLTIMTENLRTTKYNDSTDIPFITTGGTWSVTTPLSCYYENDSQKGMLYNFYAVETGKLAPKGWHTATSEDWIYLDSLVNVDYVDGYVKAICFTSGWLASDIPNTPGNNQSTNNAWKLGIQPTGYRDAYGVFSEEGSTAFFWGDPWANLLYAYTYKIDYNASMLTQTAKLKSLGASVRCVKDY